MIYLQDHQNELQIRAYIYVFVWIPLLLSFLEKVSISTDQHETHEQLQLMNFVLEYPRL